MVAEITKLKKALGLPGSIREAGVAEKEFHAQLDTLAANAFDDQCTGANPRYPLIPEIKDLFLRAYEGKD